MAPRGRKPELPANKAARGTERNDRQYEVIEAPTGLVVPPDGMPEGAILLWHDYAPIADLMGTLKPADAMSFAQWCVMSWHLQQSWQLGADPAPSSYIQQWRTLGELFGLAGEKSRLASKVINDPQARGNPFARRGKR